MKVYTNTHIHISVCICSCLWYEIFNVTTSSRNGKEMKTKINALVGWSSLAEEDIILSDHKRCEYILAKSVLRE